MKPVERVARALCAHNGTSWEAIAYIYHRDARQEYINLARIAMDDVRQAIDRHHVSRLDARTARVVFDAMTGTVEEKT